MPKSTASESSDRKFCCFFVPAVFVISAVGRRLISGFPRFAKTQAFAPVFFDSNPQKIKAFERQKFETQKNAVIEYLPISGVFLIKLAERQGFEPWVPREEYN